MKRIVSTLAAAITSAGILSVSTVAQSYYCAADPSVNDLSSSHWAMRYRFLDKDWPLCNTNGFIFTDTQTACRTLASC